MINLGQNADATTGLLCPTTLRRLQTRPLFVRLGPVVARLQSTFAHPRFRLRCHAGHPHREQWHQMGRHFKERFHRLHRHEHEYEDIDDDPELYPRPPNGTCRVQAIRSVSDWSHGVLTEHSIQNACEYTLHRGDSIADLRSAADIQLILEANHFIYIGVYDMLQLGSELIVDFYNRESVLVSDSRQR